jgi:hypothetical protein
MNRIVEMNSNVENVILTEPQSVKFVEGGEKIQIEFRIKSEEWVESGADPEHPKRDTHRVLMERSGGDLFSGGLAVSFFGLTAGED